MLTSASTIELPKSEGLRQKLNLRYLANIDSNHSDNWYSDIKLFLALRSSGGFAFAIFMILLVQFFELIFFNFIQIAFSNCPSNRWISSTAS